MTHPVTEARPESDLVTLADSANPALGFTDEVRVTLDAMAAIVPLTVCGAV